MLPGVRVAPPGSDDRVGGITLILPLPLPLPLLLDCLSNYTKRLGNFSNSKNCFVTYLISGDELRLDFVWAVI